MVENVTLIIDTELLMQEGFVNLVNKDGRRPRTRKKLGGEMSASARKLVDVVTLQRSSVEVLL